MEVEYHFNRRTRGCGDLDRAILVKFIALLELKDSDGVDIAHVDGAKENPGILANGGICWSLGRFHF